MASDKPQRVRQILELALSLPRDERAGQVAEACAGDTDLQREIEGLLSLYERSPRGTGDSSPFSSPTTFSPDSPEVIAGAVTIPSPMVRGVSSVATSWGGFVLLEELGRGGFGVVHRAWDATLKRDVALKIIDVRRLPGVSEETVLREGQLMARVRHPNVVTVYSAQRIGPEVGLTMEYIKGRTLSRLVAEDGPLGAHEAALVGMSLCDALTAVHRLGLVHRDLKASNVMRESGGRILLMDFGAGREIGVGGDGRAQVLGTPVYMAPEVLLGSRGTSASDLYSLGVLLYNLVTADYPVRGARMDELRLSHLAGERVPLGERRPELPAPFVDAVEKALASDPAARPSTAVAFKRALVDAMPYLPPDSGGRRRGRPASPRPKTATPTTPLASPARSLGPLQAFAVGVGVLVIGLAVLGFVTTMEFNYVLGRSGDFGNEQVWTYPILGARSLLGSVVYVMLAVVLLNVVMILLRAIGHAVPPVSRLTARLTQGIVGAVRRAGLNKPTALAQTLSVVGVAGLGAILWRFQSLLLALMNYGYVNDAPAGDLLLLSGANEHTHLLYRRSLELLIVVLMAGLVHIGRQWRAGTKAHLSPVAATVAAVVVALFLLVAPWRLLFGAEFPQATFDSHSCYIIGENPTDLLVNCPDMPTQRNTVVARGDGRLQQTRRIGNLFDAYASATPTGRR